MGGWLSDRSYQLCAWVSAGMTTVAAMLVFLIPPGKLPQCLCSHVLL